MPAQFRLIEQLIRRPHQVDEGPCPRRRGCGVQGDQLADPVVIDRRAPAVARQQRRRHAGDAGQQDLVDGLFQDVQASDADDGIDVASLTNLAKQTGGRYYHARDIKSLKLMLDEVSKDLQQEKPYQHTFTSARGFDGTVHRIAVKLVHEVTVVDTKTGETKTVDETLNKVEADRSVRGVVVAEMNPFVYLGFLAILALLLAVPMTLGRMWRSLS